MAQFSRYFYYIGRIKTIQLEYTEALNYLQEVSLSLSLSLSLSRLQCGVR
jgi:hypothetical protein